MGRKKNDPVAYNEFMEFKASVESRFAALETDLKWMKKTLENVSKSLDKYKWWIVGSILGSVILSWLIKFATLV